MKFTKILGLVAVAALALMAFASTASATTLETKGVAVNASETISASAAGSITLSNTLNETANTCLKSNVKGKTETTFSATKIGGLVSELTFEECTEDAKEKIVVDVAGSLEVENISGTTNGTVFSKNAKVTTPSPFGKLTCTTSSTGTDIGKLTGVKEGTATMDITAVLNCGSLISAKWNGTYNVTTANLGVGA